MGILHICNLLDFLLLNLTEVMSTKESEFSYRQIPGVTSLPSILTAKKCTEDEIFGRQDILSFFQENPKIKIFKLPTDVIGTLMQFVSRNSMTRKNSLV